MRNTNFRHKIIIIYFLFLLEAVRRSHGTVKRAEVGRSAGKWLSGSRDRDGKRLARLANSRRDHGRMVDGDAVMAAGDAPTAAAEAVPDAEEYSEERELRFEEL